eukprot:3436643-Prymnesium_polylepis.2
MTPRAGAAARVQRARGVCAGRSAGARGAREEWGACAGGVCGARALSHSGRRIGPSQRRLG